MKFIGNVIWLLFGGFFSALGWWLVGVLWCITIIGIPVGVQCFKLSSISLNPFGKDVVGDGGLASCLLNIIWFGFSGSWLAIGNVIFGVILCSTIIGFPFGKQFFKIAKLAIAPFGVKVIKVR